MAKFHADVVELVDTLDSGSSVRKVMEVQVLSSAFKTPPVSGGVLSYRVLLFKLGHMRISFFPAFAGVFFFGISLCACSSGDSFEICDSGTVAGLDSLTAATASSNFCRTIKGEVAYRITGLCAPRGCFYLYDVDASGNPGSGIYLSDTSAFPKSWKDTSKTHITRVTGKYYPAEEICTQLTAACQRAFYVKDVDD